MSQEDPGRAGDDEGRIPKERFDAAVGKERSEKEQARADAAAANARAAAAEARLAELERQSKAAPVPTARQIAEAIESGQIENADGIDAIANMTKQQAIQEAIREFESRSAQQQQSKHVDEQLARWVKAVPSLTQGGSEEDLRAGQAYMELIESGLPHGDATKLAAIKMTLGPIDAYEAKPLRREGHPETGGGSAGRGRSGDEGVPDVLVRNPETRKQYDQMIAKGMYSGYKDPSFVAEMKILERREARSA